MKSHFIKANNLDMQDQTPIIDTNSQIRELDPEVRTNSIFSI